MLSYFIFIALLGYTKAFQLFSLNSDNEGTWTVHNTNKSISIHAKVPGGIYSDLTNSHILREDVYYRSNDEDYRWVAYENWTYERNFTVPNIWKSESKETLVFHGLDTVAEITLNDVQLASQLDNMFVRHVLNVKGVFQYDGLPNHLRIQFISPVKTVQERAQLWPRVVPDCVPASYHGECHANLIRKTQSSFSWDWGPAFPSSGIWKDVQLVTYNAAILRDVTVLIEKSDFYKDFQMIWKATFVLHLEAVAPKALVEGVGRVVLFIADAPGGIITGEQTIGPTAANRDGELQVEISLQVPEGLISLWWPNGMGSQTLYQAIVSFKATASGIPEESTIKKINVGFRAVELDESEVGENGKTFLLRFNGGAMYSKGSNWIPPHALPEMTSAVNGKEMTKDLLLSAKEVGINMLRVWGGGNYESDYFYDLADQLGILIWHDMMFACSMYPTEPSFLNSVKLEVKQQARRLQHHPSIVIWAGNNENEVALRQNWYGTATNFTSYLKDYVVLYNMINTTVLSVDPAAVFLFSSPSNGVAMRGDTGPVADDPQSRYYGDIHYYNYLADGWSPSTYPLCRFASEYGFQSLPSMETLKTAGPTSDDWGVNKDFFMRRQHHAGGYQEMIIEIQRHLEMPSNTESEEGIAKLVYLTQVNQAMSLKTETEVYRRGMAITENGGNGEIQGATMGSLYWQLNDIWQAPSWATLEYGGKWKMAHYYAANFFTNLMVSPWVTPYNELQVYLLSTRPNIVTSKILNCQLTIKVYHWSEPCSFKRQTIDSQLLPLYGVKAFNASLENYLRVSGCNGSDFDSLKNSCFLVFDLKFNDSAHESPSNFLLVGSPKNAAGFQKANITITSVGEPFSTIDAGLKEHYPYSAQINISSDGVALFVWLEADGVKGRFSSNGFLLIADDDDEICRRSDTGEELSSKCGDQQGHMNCSVPGNTSPSSSSQANDQTIASNVKTFTQTITFYFREKPVDSSLLRHSLTITHLLG